MDHYRAYELHFRFSREVDELEKELETEKQNALQELQKAKNEIENRRLEERSMLQKRLGTIPLPPDLTQFIEDKRDFYLRQATQNYEERLENDRKRFIEKVSAVNEKWRMLPFDIEEDSVGVRWILQRVHDYFGRILITRCCLVYATYGAANIKTVVRHQGWNTHIHALSHASSTGGKTSCLSPIK